MSYRKLHLRTAACLLAVASLAASAGASLAQSRIGAASVVQNDVSALRQGGDVALSTGDSVFRAETIATGERSSARLTFLDDTNVAIGPASRVVLNEFVYAPNASAQALAINLARGAFRFSTGKLDKRAYKIQTPTATIGVRGTILDILAQDQRTLVTLVDNGQAFICATNTSRCETLSVSGQTLIIEPAGVRRSTSSTTRFSFQQYCSGSAGLCARTQFAQTGGDATQAAAPLVQPVSQRDAALLKDDPLTGCNTGSCTTSLSILNAGLLTGIAQMRERTAPVSNDLALQSIQSRPNGDGSITATLRQQDGERDGLSAAGGQIKVQIKSDPAYLYSAWGEWNGNITVTRSQESSTETGSLHHGYAIFGSLTPSAVIESKTGSATYTGTLIGDFAPVSGPLEKGAINGTISMTANFDAQTISGALDMKHGAQPWAAPTFTALPIQPLSIDGKSASFEGSFNAASGAFGSISGGFMGPSAQESVGRFDYFKNSSAPDDGLAVGVFQAKR